MKNIPWGFLTILLLLGGGSLLVGSLTALTPIVALIVMGVVVIVGLVVGNLEWNNVNIGNHNSITTTKVVNIRMEKPSEGIEEIIE